MRIRTLTRTRSCLIYVTRARVPTLICEFLPSFSTFLSKNLHISRKSSTFALAIGTKRTHRLFIETYKPIQTNIVILQYVGGIFLWCNTRAKPARKGSVQFFFYKDRQIFFRVPCTTNAFPRIGHRIPLLEPLRSSAYPTAHCSAAPAHTRAFHPLSTLC